ncbi:unnamed protein product [Rotaria sp. Silwood1]|nr:unnamed protein product [Rotaria sp. Silwood1]CAF4975615.1 unnamed protein product [Rotaria sp. Silwood1]
MKALTCMIQSERSDEKEKNGEEVTKVEPEDFSNDSIVHVIFRHGGSILFHITASSQPQYGQLTRDQSIIRRFLLTLLAFFKPNYDCYHNDCGKFSVFIKYKPEKLPPG